ncbi:MFS transporter [Arthrobacter sp. MDB2-24]
MPVKPLGSRLSGRPAAAKSRSLALALLVVAGAQLMLVLDDSIANIALPSIQNELAVSSASLPWVINAYILAFGGLLLFGGRLGDLFGRRRILQIGIGLFTISSLVAGIAPTGPVLVAARAVQGLGAALTAPNALALISTTFPAGEARNKALALYGAMSGLGVTVGLLLGGVLTGMLGWRWVFFINLPIGLALLAGTRTLVDAPRHTGRPDVPGAVTGTGGIAALVFAIIHGGEQGWDVPATLIVFALAAVLLPAFVTIETRSADPMLPLRLFADRNRTGSYLGMLFVSFGPMGTFYLLTSTCSTSSSTAPSGPGWPGCPSAPASSSPPASPRNSSPNSLPASSQSPGSSPPPPRSSGSRPSPLTPGTSSTSWSGSSPSPSASGSASFL